MESGQTTESTTTTGPTTATETTTTADDATATETTEDEGPGYKKNHWHGRLFFVITGELVDLCQPKYYLENLESRLADLGYLE